MSPEDHRIPMGYSFEIQQNAAESHGLPLDCAPMRMKEASSWSWIVAKFLDMVNPKRFDEAFPPLFTLSVNSIRSIISRVPEQNYMTNLIVN